MYMLVIIRILFLLLRVVHLFVMRYIFVVTIMYLSMLILIVILTHILFPFAAKPIRAGHGPVQQQSSTGIRVGGAAVVRPANVVA